MRDLVSSANRIDNYCNSIKAKTKIKKKIRDPFIEVNKKAKLQV